ncbi:MAG: toxic anion resistance protein, partial [Clostridia bacterium]|nr:toxic anion resistance protein [Clostridia bacterium]
TNELLKKNAEALHQATVEVAKESERGIVDIETLQHTNRELISTLEEVQKIQEEGRAGRRAAEAELTKIEGELRSNLLKLKGAPETETK